ncbi:MAG: hypothetical protein KBS91_03995 [Firmicutes bacterium]|nr:hypothetical protein [Candidatus Caballimonas caccae]
MKRIIQTNFEDKPYKLLANLSIKELATECKLPYNIKDLDDILLTQGQKNLLSLRSRCHWLSSYLNKAFLPYLLKELTDNSNLEYYAYCVHDCDTWQEDFKEHKQGDAKDVHFHILLCFSEKVTLSVSAYLFHTESVTAINTYNLSKQYNYLTHNSEKCRREHKYQYSQEDIVSNDIEYFKSRCVDKNSDEKALNCVDDMVRGISTRELVRKYGTFAVMQYRNLREISQRIRDENKRKDDSKNCICIIDNNGEIQHIRNLDLYERSLIYEKGKTNIKITD